MAEDFAQRLEVKTKQYEELNIFMEDERCVRESITQDLKQKLANADNEVSLLQEAVTQGGPHVFCACFRGTLSCTLRPFLSVCSPETPRALNWQKDRSSLDVLPDVLRHDFVRVKRVLA